MPRNDFVAVVPERTSASTRRARLRRMARLGDPQTDPLRLDALASGGWDRNVTDPDS